MPHGKFQVGDLTAIIGDNEAYGDHAAGYNGVHSLTHRSEATSLFVPRYAGLNYEHIFDGEKDLRDLTFKRSDIFFEPRRAPMEYSKIADNEAELHQPPTPTFQLESWTRFKLVAPHYIDFTFRCKPTQHNFQNGYIGAFWASYINGPDDKSIYFRHKERWQQLCTQRHNDESTVLHEKDGMKLKVMDNPPDTLYIHFSQLRFDEPFFYGNFKNHVFMMMFEPKPKIRFTHSPSGGGDNKETQSSNPAWDWQFIVPEYDVMKEYSYRARAVYRERCSRAEILKEYTNWRESLG